jgi:REP element-mobilizing transposase RayT
MNECVGARASSPHKGWHERGYLPHFDNGAVVQTITFRLADSLPRAVYEAITVNSSNDIDRWTQLEHIIDQGRGSRLLGTARNASITRDALYHFDGVRYLLLRWVVMPNHVHAMIEQREGFPLESIVHSWKSFTANEINRLESRRGLLWAADYFDRYIRDGDHYQNAASYIENNPVKAKLVTSAELWRYSSAFQEMS